MSAENEKKPIYHGEYNGKWPIVTGYDDNGDPILDEEIQRGIEQTIEEYRLQYDLLRKRAQKFQEAVMEATTITRDMFEEGYIGECAFNLVQSGTPCAAYVDADKTKCGNPPRMTVDFDVAGRLEMLTACTPAHAEIIQSTVDKDLRRFGYSSTPSINGAGRDYATELSITPKPVSAEEAA